MTDKTIKITGYSEGDSSVGISKCDFSIDTGLTELSEEDKRFIIKGILRDIYELHDNGTLHFNFSDEEKDEYFEYPRRLTYEMVKKIDEEEKRRVSNNQ